MASQLPRAGARSMQLQRIARRRTRPAAQRVAAPLGARRPGRRRQVAGPVRAAIAQPADLQPAPAVVEKASWWSRLQQAVGTLAAAATLAAVAFTWQSIQQVNNEQVITREGQITDRYNAAVENLGHDSLEVRLGGIYALQRIMHDSDRDQPVVISVLSTYIRTHATQTEKSKSGPDQPTSDVVAALTALATRDPRHDGTAGVDLTGAYLYGWSLYRPNLSGWTLDGANLEAADLQGANLKDASLKGAHLAGANFTEADLSDAWLPEVNLTGAFLEGAHLKGTELMAADLTGAMLEGADLEGAYLADAELRDTILIGADLRDVELGDADLDDAILEEKDLGEAEVIRPAPEEADRDGTKR
ncbi:pentapeptide repeat-containing protein [Streptomyces chartreusis]|uniref:pentapeptide repeat-containing protein n=1 Tax=Streptomyces chartreusis TaxID=1969 RepID=UPI00365F8ECC